MGDLLELLKRLESEKEGQKEKVTLLPASTGLYMDEELTHQYHIVEDNIQIWNYSGKRKKAILQFELSSLKGKILGKAYLRLVNGAGHDWNTTAELSVRPLLKPWEPGRDGIVEAGEVHVYQRIFRVPEWQPTWLLDITTIVNKWLEGKLENYGLLLEGGIDTEPLNIKSRVGHAGQEPMLVITHQAEILSDDEKLTTALRALKELYVYRDISWSGSFVRNAQAKAHKLGLGEGYLQALKYYFDYCLTEEGQFRNVSEVWFYVSACGEALLYLFEITRLEKYKKAIDLLRDKLVAMPRSPEGIIMAADRVEIELYFCVLPFLAFYHDAFKDTALLDLVIEQAITMFDLATTGMEDGIPLQNLGNPRSKGWSRGMGWMMAGMGKLVSSPGLQEHTRYDQLVKRFRALSKTMLDYQLPDGMWRSIIQDDSKPREVTGTALIALGLVYGAQVGVLEREVLQNADRALEALTAYSITGMEMTCCFPMNFQERYEVTDFSGISDQGYGCWMELVTVRAGGQVDI